MNAVIPAEAGTQRNRLGPDFRRGDGEAITGIPNGRLGMMLLVGTETMLFSSFIGAYIVLRASARSWPPMGVPALTLDLSPVNTAVLVLSSIFIYFKRVAETFLLGLMFLVLQGLEFHRLYARGLTLQSGPYGSFFYALSTCHGLHVLGGLAILAAVLVRAHSGAPLQAIRAWIGNAELYWHFVTGVWLVLFAVLYLA